MMAEIFDTIKVEGVGSEIVNAFLLTTFVTGFLTILYFAWKTTSRRPLEFDMFLVEMHSMTEIRLVEVLYVAPNFNRNVQFTTLLNILRYRARQARPEDGSLRSVSDTNIVIQSPSNIADPQAQSNLATNVHNALTLFDIEMPANRFNEPNPSRDSQLAAAAAITVLGRSASEEIALPHNLLEQLTTGQFRFGRPAAEATLIHMQYLNPIRRRVVGYPPSYRMPISLTLARDAANTSQQQPPSNNSPPTTNPTNSSQNIRQRQTREESQLRSEGAISKPNIPREETQTSNREMVKLKLKFLDDTERIVETELANTVLNFKRTHFTTEVNEGKVIRLIFRGRLLRDDNSSLEFYGLYNEAIVHCHISTTPYAQFQNERASRNAPFQQEQAQPDSAHPLQEVDRTNIWFFRLVFNFFTAQITSLPIQLQISLRRLILRNQNRLQPSGNAGLFPGLYRRLHQICIEPFLEPLDPVASADEAAGNSARPMCIGNYLLWIFGIQCALVWMFVSYFPQLCDRTAFGLLLLLTLYFFFVVIPERTPSNVVIPTPRRPVAPTQ